MPPGGSVLKTGAQEPGDKHLMTPHVLSALTGILQFDDGQAD